jgi:alpha-L-rhamnosidase
VKRCLYLLAAFPREDGLLAGCVFEKPVPAHGHEFLGDYAVLWGVTLSDYVEATGDVEAGRELWPTFKTQLEVLTRFVGDDGLFKGPRNPWIFIDWHDKLDRSAAMQAVLIFGYKHAIELARRLGVKNEIPEYAKRVKGLEIAALEAFYDTERGLYVSGPERQVSLASQA